MAESEEEVAVLVQRVVKDITNAFKRNPNIDEIGLISCPEARYNRSPIVLVENKLGVESWCVKFLLPYVHNKLLLHRQRKHWLERPALVDITCTLLLLNPDFTTAWNVRKELVQSGVLTPERDLYLGQLALTKFPKSPETWIHRRWVLQQILRECSPPAGDRKEGRAVELDPRAERSPRLGERLARTLRQEMKVCSDAAGRYPSNYNAWSHRTWVLQQLAPGNAQVLHDELSSMQLWVSMHVSDHSGFHYRQFLLKALVRDLSQGTSPQHRPTSPQHRPTSPHHRPTSPQHRPTSPQHRPLSQATSPQHRPTSPQHRPLSQATSPQHRPTSPQHRPLSQATSPQHRPTSPQHRPTPAPNTNTNHHHHHPAHVQANGEQEEEEQQQPGSAVTQLFHQEMALCTDLIQSYPGHETLWCHRRHVFYLWHHWRRDHQHRSCESPHLHPPAGPPTEAPAGGSRVGSLNGLPTSDAMEVDGGALPDPRDTKRLKRGPPGPCPPALPSEHSFVAAVLDGCPGPEQGRFARAYRKWLDTVVGQ